MDQGRVKLWLRTWVQNPFATGTLICVLAILWPRTTEKGTDVLPVNVLVVRNPERYSVAAEMSTFCGMLIIDPDNESWDQSSRLLRNAPDDMAMVYYESEVERSGVLAPTRERVNKVVRFESSKIGSDEPPGSRDQARRAFVEWLRTAHNAVYRTEAEEISAGDVARVTILWPGYLRNAAVLAVLGLLLYSLLWFGTIPDWVVRARGRRRLARGRCPACGYVIAGLPGTVCPECGRSWEVRAGDALVGGAERT